MGDALDGDLETIWNSDRYDQFREHYRETCGNCDLWTIDMVDVAERDAFSTSSKPG
jgi:hypothetical protein